MISASRVACHDENHCPCRLVRTTKGTFVSTAAERATQLDLVARLKSSYPELPDAPTPDMLDHDRITAYLKPVHDVGGEPDAPMKYENKQYEQWEEMTYVICEVLGVARDLAVRGAPPDGQRRRRAGRVSRACRTTVAGCWRSRRVLVEKHHIGLTELSERMARGPGALRRRPRGQEAGGAAQVRRRRIAGQAQQPPQPRGRQGRSAGLRRARPASRSSRSVTRSWCANCPSLFYTRTPEYVRGAPG